MACSDVWKRIIFCPFIYILHCKGFGSSLDMIIMKEHFINTILIKNISRFRIMSQMSCLSNEAILKCEARLFVSFSVLSRVVAVLYTLWAICSSYC